jgi:hypothetical protein
LGAHRKTATSVLRRDKKKQDHCRGRRNASAESQKRIMRYYPGDSGLKMPFKEKKTASSKPCSLFYL